MGTWFLVAAPLGITYLQAAADLRTYDADPACAAGIAATPGSGGGCGVGIVTVGNGSASAAGRYELSVKFADGARREIPASAHAFRLFRAPGTLLFVQVRQTRITLFGDERYVETTSEHPARRIASARTAAIAGAVAAASLAVAFAAVLRRDGRLRRSNDAA